MPMTSPIIAEIFLAGKNRDIARLAGKLSSQGQSQKAQRRRPLRAGAQAERPYQAGDQIAYYVTGTKAKVKISGNCKLASEWDAKNPDENVEHYKAKLKELYEKFKPWIEGDGAASQEPELAIDD